MAGYENYRHRPRHHQLLRGRNGRRRGARHRKRIGLPHDALHRRLRERRDACRASCQGPGCHQSGHTLAAVKRLIGGKFADNGLQRHLSALPYKVVAARNGDVWIEIDNDRLAPQQVLAAVLRELKRSAEEYLGEGGYKAVVTVPPHGRSARTAWRAADRGALRHRRQRHPQRLRQGQSHRQGAVIVIRASSGLSEDEIANMVKEAEAHAAEDARFEEMATLRDNADSLVHSAHKIIADAGDKPRTKRSRPSRTPPTTWSRRSR